MHECEGKRSHFNPRPPRGGRPVEGLIYGKVSRISIHALREEGDSVPDSIYQVCKISIHALREEGDLMANLFPASPKLFQSTPSARRATRSRSISFCAASNFNPRPPRGGRPRDLHPLGGGVPFQSTPSARRATAEFLAEIAEFLDFNPRPPRGGRPCWRHPFAFA